MSVFNDKILPAASFAAKKLRGGLPEAAAAAGRALNSVKLNIDVEKKYDNSAALTPPMGWSSWNLFRNRINENLIYETGEALVKSGLADCGYVYLNIDDCWQSSMRDADGRLQGDLVNFPSGIGELVKKVNALGLKLGIYSSNGTLTCEDLPASLYHERIDAETFAGWGIEYFKYDFCHNVPVPMRAPSIEGIAISRGAGDEEMFYPAATAFLGGSARLAEEPKLSTGRYITGLSAGGGTAEFPDVEVEADGEYVLTLCLLKKSNADKYAEITVNGGEVYTTVVPSTRGAARGGRHQVKVKLKAGKNSIKIGNPVASRFDSAAKQYTVMGEELKRAVKMQAKKSGEPGKPIVFSICEWGLNLPWQWGAHAGNLWRTTPDIRPSWGSIVGIYELNVLLYKHASPGSWNDPDMLEVGNGDLTEEENRSHFTLWAMMAAPLILGNDVRRFVRPDGTPDTADPIYRILTNRDVIAVNQDRLGVQCRRIKTNGLCDVLIKPLEDGSAAVCFFNKGGSSAIIEQDLSEVVSKDYISLEYSDSYTAVELWDKSEQTVSGRLSASVPAHGVKIYKVSAKK